MSRKWFFSATTLILISLYTLAIRIELTRASETIYIRYNGTIDPPEAPITRNGSIYTITATINDSIIVEKNDSLIDGKGYAIQGDSLLFGLKIHSATNVTIQNTKIKNCSIGIYLNLSSNVNIIGNNVSANSEHGIYLERSSNSTISGNKLENNFKGIEFFESHNNTIDSNLIKAEEIYNDYSIKLNNSLFNRIQRNIIEFNDEGIYLFNSSHNMINENTVQNNYYGVILANSSVNLIEANNITNDEGVRFRFSSNNIFQRNNLIKNGNHGFWLFHSSGNIILRNRILFNRLEGVKITFSFSNNISANDISGNEAAGLYILGENNTISNNNITSNQYGVWLAGSNNKIFHNNFVNNTQQVYIQTSAHASYWDDGYPEGGNYWEDFLEKYPNANDIFHGEYQNETGNDGFWDNPYFINENNQDNYPIIPELSLTSLIIFALTTYVLVHKKKIRKPASHHRETGPACFSNLPSFKSSYRLDKNQNG